MLHTFKHTPEWEGGEVTHRHWGPPWCTPPDSVGMYAGLWCEQGEDPISFQTINQSHSSALLTGGARSLCAGPSWALQVLGSLLGLHPPSGGNHNCPQSHQCPLGAESPR